MPCYQRIASLIVNFGGDSQTFNTFNARLLFALPLFGFLYFLLAVLSFFLALVPGAKRTSFLFGLLRHMNIL